MATVTVRYWAAARTAAGTTAETRDADTLADVLAQIGRDRPELSRLLRICSFLVDGSRVEPEHQLREGAIVDVLPPFAGG